MHSWSNSSCKDINCLTYFNINDIKAFWCMTNKVKLKKKKSSCINYTIKKFLKGKLNPTYYEVRSCKENKIHNNEDPNLQSWLEAILHSSQQSYITMCKEEQFLTSSFTTKHKINNQEFI